MQLENLIPQRDIYKNDQQSDEKYHINMIDDKEYDKIYQIGENKEETLNTDIEVLKLRKLTLQKKNYLEKESNEIKQMDMIDDKESDERNHINKNYEEKVTEDIEVLKLGKLSLQKNKDNIEKNVMKEIVWI